jgi:hypothetical protein
MLSVADVERLLFVAGDSAQTRRLAAPVAGDPGAELRAVRRYLLFGGGGGRTADAPNRGRARAGGATQQQNEMRGGVARLHRLTQTLAKLPAPDPAVRRCYHLSGVDSGVEAQNGHHLRAVMVLFGGDALDLYVFARDLGAGGDTPQMVRLRARFAAYHVPPSSAAPGWSSWRGLPPALYARFQATIVCVAADALSTGRASPETHEVRRRALEDLAGAIRDAFPGAIDLPPVAPRTRCTKPTRAFV